MMQAKIEILGAKFLAEYDYRESGSDVTGTPTFDVELLLLRFVGGQITPWLKVSKWLRPLIEMEIAASQFDLIEADYNSE